MIENYSLEKLSLKFKYYSYAVSVPGHASYIKSYRTAATTIYD